MTAPASVAEALDGARHAGISRLDAQLLMAHVLDRPRAWLLAHGEAPLDAAALQAWEAGCARCLAGEPLAYVFGEKEFHGLSLQVDARVLVPRPDTETLVDWALGVLEGPMAGLPRPSVADLGTGSGAIALALKSACPRAAVTATDASAGAIAVARANAQHHGLAVDFRLGHWWKAVAEGEAFDLVVSNPPYIAANDAHLSALTHEPHDALVSGADGLDALREIVAEAPRHLVPGGWLLLEHGYDQAAAVARLLAHAGMEAIEHRADLGGVLRCTGGSLRTPPHRV